MSRFILLNTDTGIQSEVRILPSEIASISSDNYSTQVPVHPPSNTQQLHSSQNAIAVTGSSQSQLGGSTYSPGQVTTYTYTTQLITRTYITLKSGKDFCVKETPEQIEMLIEKHEHDLKFGDKFNSLIKND